jgi:hypothetical protein
MDMQLRPLRKNPWQVLVAPFRINRLLAAARRKVQVQHCLTHSVLPHERGHMALNMPACAHLGVSCPWLLEIVDIIRRATASLQRRFRYLLSIAGQQQPARED